MTDTQSTESESATAIAVAANSAVAAQSPSHAVNAVAKTHDQLMQGKLNAPRARVAQNMRAFQPLLPRGMSPDYMVATVLKAARKSPELLGCDERSVILAVIEC